MSTHQNQVIITDLDHWQKTIQAMIAADPRMTRFTLAYMHLMELFSRYLAEDTPPDRKRTATLWADYHSDHNFNWYIREEPVDHRSPDQSTKRLMVGGLIYHRHDGSWGIHT